MRTLLYLMLLFYITNVVVSEKFRFDNYTLFKIHVENEVQVNLLKNLQDADLRYDFWSEPTPRAGFVQVMSSPEDKFDLQNFLTKNNINAEISMNNVQEFVEKQTVKRYTRNNVRSMTWDSYYELDDIYAWMEDLVSEYPDVATLVIGGDTYEGREIKGVKISHGGGKTNIFIEGGIHAREWISPAAVCYIIYELLTSEDQETVAAAQDYDWHLFPVTNPDGYVFTHDSFRMWRKNRRPFTNGIGVDLNRNWNSNWLISSYLRVIYVLVPTLMYGSESWVWLKKHESKNNAEETRSLRSMAGLKLSDRVRNSVIREMCGLDVDVATKIEKAHGASSNPASDVYAGPGPFSEPETRSMSRYMREIGDKMELFLTFHSFGQMLLLPFGNTSEPLANYHDALNVGRRAMGALSVRYGTEYVTGNIVEVLYEATGGTDEWVKEHLNVPLVYCYELRDRNTYGFLLPPEQILPNNEETMDSVLEIIHQGRRFGYMMRAGSVGLEGSMLMVFGVIVACFTLMTS